MSDSNFGKILFSVAVGTAIGATLGVLFAPAKGAVTRRVIARSSREMKNNVSDKLEDLVDTANDIIEEIKDTASDYMRHTKDKASEIIEDM